MTPHDSVDAANVDLGTNHRWRGRNSLRRKLALVLITVSLLAVAILGVLNYLQVRELLTKQVESQLTTQGQARARSIRFGLTEVKDTVTVLAREPDVEKAVIAFGASYQELLEAPELLTQPQREALEVYYRDDVTAIYEDKGVEPPLLADLLPTTDAAQYLQYHYIVQNPYPLGDRDELVRSESDTSSYQAAHEQHHPRMRELATTLDFGDVLLIDFKTATVVYTVEKLIDLGTNLQSGPNSDSALATAITEKLTAAPLGAAVLVDFDFYAPSTGAPVMFAAAAVRNEGETVGAVAVTVPIDSLNRVMTADQLWAETGFAETGESYVVGSDFTMRSDSRLWLEDPAAYLEDFATADYPAETAAFIEAFNSTVLLQPVETEAVTSVLNGDTFAGRTLNYLNRSTLAVAEPVGVEELSWVVVSEIEWAEANNALSSYTRRMLITAAILLPIVGLLGLLLADRMTRPVEPVVAAAAQIADGDLDLEIPDLGRNEYGDVGRRINTFTADLRAQKHALTDEAQEVTKLLKSALPDRVVDQLRGSDRRLEDLADTATMIVITVTGSFDEPGVDHSWTTELASHLSLELETSAESLGIERVRSAGADHVFAAGLGSPDVAATAAAQFVLEAIELAKAAVVDSGADISFHAGLASGKVVAGLLSTAQLTYGVFGDPPRVAMALDSIAGPGEVLLDHSTASALGPEWVLEEIDSLIDLRGEPVTAQLLVGRRAGDMETIEGA